MPAKTPSSHSGGRRRPVAVVFAMPFGGHCRALRPLIGGLVDSGFDVVVFADARHAEAIRALGARFTDSFSRYPFDSVDPEAAPIPVRYVSYAGAYIDAILDEVRELDPVLVVYEAYALIGQVVGRILEIPYVAVCVWHDFRPETARQMYQSDPRVVTTNQTEAAIAHLHDRYGLTDITPLSFAVALSPHLNIYCEPPEFLSAEGASSFEPVAFYGSLVPDRASTSPHRSLSGSSQSRRVFVSFGSYLWDAFTAELSVALTRLADGFAAHGDVDVLITLGNEAVDEATVRSFARPNVRVERWVDQVAALAEADVFVTHHGLQSTHEAIDNLVPMLSYPFFGDQPSQAAFCQVLGIAVPLGTRERAPRDDEIARALEHVSEQREAMSGELARVRSWEDAVIAGRPEVDERIRALARSRR